MLLYTFVESFASYLRSCFYETQKRIWIIKMDYEKWWKNNKDGYFKRSSMLKGKPSVSVGNWPSLAYRILVDYEICVSVICMREWKSVLFNKSCLNFLSNINCIRTSVVSLFHLFVCYIEECNFMQVIQTSKLNVISVLSHR